MKAVKLFHISLILIAGLMFSGSGVLAQTENPKTRETVTKTENQTETKAETENKAETKTDAATVDAPKTEAQPSPTPAVAPVVNNSDKTTPATTTDDPPAEEEQVAAYYNNYLKEYRLGPNDIISIEVFGQCPDYCKMAITVPPTARISYPLIREGVLVGGKTVEQIADEITKKLDEYIIDPKVTVTLDKAMSVRYSVMGKVISPGIRIMDRKVSLYEAVLEAGGIAKDGNKKKIALVRFDAQGKLSRQEVDLTAIESGKAPMIYLNPGDQVFVPSKGFTIDKFWDILGKVSAARILFGSPF